jgi:hypothetical protein
LPRQIPREAIGNSWHRHLAGATNFRGNPGKTPRYK